MLLIKKTLFFIGLSGFSASIVLAAPAQAPQTIDGGKIYRENCAICHGDLGDANTRAKGSLRPPPRNFTTASAAAELTRERMINSVTHGRPGTAMMAHKDRLSAQEIGAVVDYIRKTFMIFPDNKTKQQLAIQAEGEQIYAKHCSVCHGDQGTTAIWARSGLNPQPRNFTTAEARQELTRERMISSVTNGRPGTAMMPHKEKLSGKQIEQVVDYIRTAFMSGPIAVEPILEPGAVSQGISGPKSQAMQGHPQIPGFNTPGAGSASMPSMQGDSHPGSHTGATPGMPSAMGPVASVDMNVPMPKGLKGDPAAGRKFYMNNCFTCHGVKGDGNGPRASFNTPRPRNFTSDASRRMLNRERIFNSITHGRVGTVMPAWGKVLNDQQIANVAEFVFATFIQAKQSSVNNPINQLAGINKKKAN